MARKDSVLFNFFSLCLAYKTMEGCAKSNQGPWLYSKHFIFFVTYYNRTYCLKEIKFITEDTKVKSTNITTIYKYN
jgi:hypothetical protein